MQGAGDLFSPASFVKNFFLANFRDPQDGRVSTCEHLSGMTQMDPALRGRSHFFAEPVWVVLGEAGSILDRAARQVLRADFFPAESAVQPEAAFARSENQWITPSHPRVKPGCYSFLADRRACLLTCHAPEIGKTA